MYLEKIYLSMLDKHIFAMKKYKLTKQKKIYNSHTMKKIMNFQNSRF